ncbi:prephenate dehydratase domain-containing protein [Aporhodopirellula aestuarii]|uniref:prephenate dehydratase n=1 Tax=Aporhodopirellula aestuarii TaxID=2950107 RepID=A0ABT0UCY2_9BACT|nr:prephenate dehydratase domain-containing protein [Aporhodopirellula aestuarii]MCM2374657.1 hypothetical protein [Aporhodopirellula aestuarii]
MQANQNIVAYLGPAGTHTHVAAMDIFGPVDFGGFQYRNVTTLSDILEAVASGEAGWGVAPYFNTTSGTVEATFPAVVDDVARSHFAELEVCLSVPVRIAHDLLGNCAGAPELILSKPEAYAQCKKTLLREFPNHRFEKADSTAQAAARAEKERGPTAALASKQLLPFHRKLQLTQEACQDVKVNVTRFMVVRRKDSAQTLVDEASGGLKRRTWILINNSDTRSNLAKLLAAAERWGLGTSAISGKVTDPESGEMRLLVELDSGINTWKTKHFLSEVAYLGPIVIGSPHVLERPCPMGARKWAEAHAIEHDSTGRLDLFNRLDPIVRQGLVGVQRQRLFEHPEVKTMESVWQYLGVEPDRMLNTQCYVDREGGQFLFCVVRGDQRVGFGKVKALFGKQWQRAEELDLQNAGQRVGAISPLTVPAGAKVVFDQLVPKGCYLFLGSGDETISVSIHADEPIFANADRCDIHAQ